MSQSTAAAPSQVIASPGLLSLHVSVLLLPKECRRTCLYIALFQMDSPQTDLSVHNVVPNGLAPSFGSAQHGAKSKYADHRSPFEKE